MFTKIGWGSWISCYDGVVRCTLDWIPACLSISLLLKDFAIRRDSLLRHKRREDAHAANGPHWKRSRRLYLAINLVSRSGGFCCCQEEAGKLLSLRNGSLQHYSIIQLRSFQPAPPRPLPNSSKQTYTNGSITPFSLPLGLGQVISNPESSPFPQVQIRIFAGLGISS